MKYPCITGCGDAGGDAVFLIDDNRLIDFPIFEQQVLSQGGAGTKHWADFFKGALYKLYIETLNMGTIQVFSLLLEITLRIVKMR